MRKKHLFILICLLANALAMAKAGNRIITGIVVSGEDNELLSERLCTSAPMI
ncbi:hypothetical protein JCM6294_632 [Bacteroides pyogenes DSM 20611 = JCM 6294]|uniref:TonB-dependent receptor n=1 Tax=Bacteroides pyogenes DSM 20611 = JCM 6294 TaxID=1121100 RepID=W4PDG2_9BACE|nr:hypothetical protein JCM6294_632 [Bacteroides pyogenes DSM 20611 = JCM 6294]